MSYSQINTIEAIRQIHGQKDDTLWHSINDTFHPRYRWLSRHRCSINHIYSCTIRHSSLFFCWPKVGKICGDFDFITRPADRLSPKDRVIRFYLFTRQWPLIHDVSSRSGPSSTSNRVLDRYRDVLLEIRSCECLNRRKFSIPQRTSGQLWRCKHVVLLRLNIWF